MNDPAGYSDLTRAFEAHEIDNAAFRHAEHVTVAFGLLKRYDFIDAAAIYARGIRTLASKAGAPGKFNLTITYAFMSLIAERMAGSACDDAERFIQDNPDLMSKDILAKWYAPDRLHSDIARSTFLMPVASKDGLAEVGQGRMGAASPLY
ncbi:hypothetical protein [Inquilinus sp. CAU 1745]|uniref:hypothetical protein n=1 Tax=Inquilinus sp. CAU 1745 TaxID=3140369 RepID=UPI00325C1190